MHREQLIIPEEKWDEVLMASVFLGSSRAEASSSENGSTIELVYRRNKIKRDFTAAQADYCGNCNSLNCKVQNLRNLKFHTLITA